MRFKAHIQNILTFAKFVASLASLGPVAWVRLNEREIRFTIIPEQGTQVWAVLSIDAIFSTYTVQSAANNVINLEVPLPSLHRAIKSAISATSASIRLTKKNNIPLLSLTIFCDSPSSTTHSSFIATGTTQTKTSENNNHEHSTKPANTKEREMIITQDVPVRVLSEHLVHGLHEPRCREPDVHVQLPPLVQIKSISDRFTRLALAARSSNLGFGGAGPRLDVAANMHGCLRISIKTEAMNISSLWTGLHNPDLDPAQIEGGEAGIQQHPSTRMKTIGSADGLSEEGWARVCIDGRDWGKVLSVGRLGGRVIACFSHDHALILYVYLASESGGDESVLTYYVSAYNA